MRRHPVARVGEIPPGGRKLLSVGRLAIGIFNVAGELRAYRNACPHAGAPVCEGRLSGTSLPSKVYEYAYGLEGCILRCPWHGWEFDLRTGEHLVDPATRLRALPLAAGAAENLDPVRLEASGEELYVLLPE
jgi:nitrite reductase/ring-hydroxylating ferredoxin subunit